MMRRRFVPIFLKRRNASSVPPSYITPLFSDTFDGTIIDTGKWTIVNPQPTQVVFSQNNEYDALLQGADTGYLDNHWASVPSFNVAINPTLVFTVDFKTTSTELGNGRGYIYLAKNYPSELDVLTLRNDGANTVAIEFKIGGSSQFNQTFTTPLNLTNYQTFKFVLTSAGFDVYVWDTSSWLLLKSHATAISGDYNFVLDARSLGADGNTVNYDNVYVCAEDFDSQYPSLTP
jgi:hypothetical protein